MSEPRYYVHDRPTRGIVWALIYTRGLPVEEVQLSNRWPFDKSELGDRPEETEAQVICSGELVHRFVRVEGEWIEVAQTPNAMQLDEQAAQFDAAMHNVRCEIVRNTTTGAYYLKCVECMYDAQKTGQPMDEQIWRFDLPHNPSPEQAMHVKVVHVEQAHAR